MGYQVVGVSNGIGQPSGQTIITYQPGRQSQAQALARRLPGQKVVVQAQGSIPAGAVVTIR
jgi:predicted dinucleotide-binding enzyme